MPALKKHTDAIAALMPKDRSKFSPEQLLALAKKIVAVLKALGFDLGSILDILKANSLPDPTKK